MSKKYTVGENNEITLGNGAVMVLDECFAEGDIVVVESPVDVEIALTIGLYDKLIIQSSLAVSDAAKDRIATQFHDALSGDCRVIYLDSDIRIVAVVTAEKEEDRCQRRTMRNALQYIWNVDIATRDAYIDEPDEALTRDGQELRNAWREIRDILYPGEKKKEEP